MPVIKISEYENASFAAFDASENVALIPMLYYRSYEGTYPDVTYESYDDKGIKYTSFKQFKEDMGDHYLMVDNEIDKSYIMAYELLLQGMAVVIKPILFDNAAYDVVDSEGTIIESRTISLENAYNILEDSIKGGALEEFKDRNLFNIKFITSGGYANCGYLFEYDEETPETEKINLTSYNVLQGLAADRGDAIAFVEFRPTFKDQKSLLEEVDKATGSLLSVGFVPWCECTTTISNSMTTTEMPASYCYLNAYARSVQSNANWFAGAGVTRGRVPGMVKPLIDIGESLMHILQGDTDGLQNVTINPIFNAGTYGYRVWGNRMLSKNYQDLYMNFLNVRVLLCDIKKQIYHAAMRVTFEPNDDIVWVNFKTLVNTTLEQMKSGRGISWYKWTREYTDQKALIKATLTIKPIEAVESFDINVMLTDEDAIVEEAAI